MQPAVCVPQETKSQVPLYILLESTLSRVGFLECSVAFGWDKREHVQFVFANHGVCSVAVHLVRRVLATLDDRTLKLHSLQSLPCLFSGPVDTSSGLSSSGVGSSYKKSIVL